MGVDEMREFQLHVIQDKKLALGTVAAPDRSTAVPVSKDAPPGQHLSPRLADCESAEEASSGPETRGGKLKIVPYTVRQLSLER